jgi:hypothetical protein
MHQPTPSRRAGRLVALALVGALALTVAFGTGAAGASTTRRGPFALVKAECNRRIDQRLLVLADMRARISATRHLTSEQKAPMVASIDETSNVLVHMYRPAVQAATTKAALRDACRSIFVDLRIFVVYLPQMRDGAQLDAVEAFDASESAKVAAAHEAGADTAALDALLGDARTKLDDAAARIPSVSPASFNADPAGTRATWDAVHADLVGAFIDLLKVHHGVASLPSAA